MYMRDVDGIHRAFQIQVVSVREGRVSHVAAFFDLSLFEQFGLPGELPA
jgi:RNA polymerase sigma-70 factor (ECF subfamily)